VLELPAEGRRVMAMVYWMWLAHPITRDTTMFAFGEGAAFFLLGAWVRAWTNGQT
jgi:hypothetical protein